MTPGVFTNHDPGVPRPKQFFTRSFLRQQRKRKNCSSSRACESVRSGQVCGACGRAGGQTVGRQRPRRFLSSTPAHGCPRAVHGAVHRQSARLSQIHRPASRRFARTELVGHPEANQEDAARGRCRRATPSDGPALHRRFLLTEPLSWSTIDVSNFPKGNIPNRRFSEIWSQTCSDDRRTGLPS